MKIIYQLCTMACLLLLTSSVVFGQTAGGSMIGTVTDPNGGAIGGAKVVAKHERTGRESETMTTSEGLFAFPNLEVGGYAITYEASGFKRLSLTNLVVSVNSQTVANAKLEAGNLSDSVTVTSEATQLQSTTTEIGTSFAPKLLKDAPIFGGGIRNPEAFIGYQAGVVNGAGAEGGISGGARRSKEILLDGASMTNPESGGVAFNGIPSVESIGEYKLINNTFAAEYGRTGGGIESFVSASGGNQFHGNVFNFHTSSALNAASWAGKASTVGTTPFRKTPFHGNEYGFALGGPIYMPKKIFGPIGGYNEDKSKSFFFFTMDNFRRTDASSRFLNLPTAKQRTGDFSELLSLPTPRVIYDPLTGSPFPGNIIPQNRFSNVSRNILPLIPQTTNLGLDQNFLATTATSRKQDSYSIKLNQNITSKHLLNFFFSKQSIDTLQTGPLPAPLLGGGGNEVSGDRPIFIRFNYDYIIAPTLNLHVMYGITKLRNVWDNQSIGQGWPARLGLKGVIQGATDAFPIVNFPAGTYQNLADTNGTKTVGSQYNFTDHLRADLSWVKGNFNWKFGTEHRWTKTTGKPLASGAFDEAGAQGSFNFANNQTASAAGAGGDSFASFLLGAVDNASATVIGFPGVSAKFMYNGWYGQTDWKVRPNLTLNLGVRYELPLGRTTDPLAFTSFDPNLNNPRSGLKGATAYLGDCAGCINKSRFADTDFSNWGPRLGLAYSFKDKTVFRLGYGIYYAAGNGLMGGFCLRCATGYSSVASVPRPSTTGAALQWDNGFVPLPNFLRPPVIDPAAGNAADDIYYINPKSGTAPRFQNWSVSIQRELPWKFVAEASYIGNRGTRLSANHFSLNLLDAKYYALGDLLNRPISDPAVVAAGYTSPYANFVADWGSTATLARALRPYPHINGPIADEYNPVGSSWYDSLQLKLDRRFGSLFTEFNYTWSKALTNASGSQTGGDSNNRNPKTDKSLSLNSKDQILALEKSYQYTDYPHIFNAVFAYDLPFGKGKRFFNGNSVMDRVIGGWTVSFTGNYTSGALILLNAPALTYPNWGFAYGRKRVNIVPGKAIQTGIDRQDLDPRAGLLPNGTYDRSKATPWLTNDFFSIPGNFELGNSPTYLTQLRNPAQYGENMGFIKRTRIYETVNIEIRAEFFNVFNRTNFGLGGTPFRPNTGNTNNFGIPTGPRSGERNGQVVAKINF